MEVRRQHGDRHHGRRAEFCWEGGAGPRGRRDAARSVLTESTRLALVQILLQRRGLKLNPITTLYYVAPASGFFLMIPWSVLEAEKLWDGFHAGDVSISPLIMVTNAACAFALNLSVFLHLGKTSALTMNVAGVIKDWLLIGMSSFLFHSKVTHLNLQG